MRKNNKKIISFFIYSLIIILFVCVLSCSSDNPDGYITVIEPIISTDDEDKVEISNNNPDDPTESDRNFSTSADLYDLHFPTQELGFIAGSNLVIRTTDKGESWKVLSHANLEFTSIYFENNSYGILGGNDNYYSYIFKTSNGGSTWEQVARVWYQNELTTVKGVYSANSGNKLVVLLNQRPNATQNYGHIYVSNNQGQDFERIGTSGSQGVSATNESDGVIHFVSAPYWKGGKYESSHSVTTYLKNGDESLNQSVIDGSNTRSEVLSPVSITLGDELGIILGENGKFAVSSDSGNNWTIRTIPQALSRDLTSAIINDTKIIVSSEDGAIYRSDDLGISWEEIASIGNKRISDIYRLSESKVLVIGEGGLIRLVAF